jgi:hypothetical protein
MTYQRLAASSVTSNISAAPFKNKDKIIQVIQAQSAQSHWQREVKNEKDSATVIKWQ